MRKPVYAICEQQRHRSACTDSLISAFVVRCLYRIIPLVSIFKISSLYLASVAMQAGLSLPWLQTPKTAMQAGLSLPWSQTPKTGFLVTRPD